jgi:GNAT superfamily N-acetyltransferase
LQLQLRRRTYSDIGRGSPRQIGLARLITDKVTFAYLTDVYILKEYQGRGLGTWLMDCVNIAVSTWPELRRIMLITHGSSEFYKERLGLTTFNQGAGGLAIMNRIGPGSVLSD